MPDYKYVTYETLDDGTIARIMLNRRREPQRPEPRPARRAERRVPRGRGRRPGAGGDPRRRRPACSRRATTSGSKESIAERTPGPDQHPTFPINGGTRKGAENLMLQEWHYFFENTKRWRNLRKITVAQVQGTVYAAGLMLMWACDLIVAADDARFADVVGTRLGMCGVEYFAHPWEFGPRTDQGADAHRRRHRRRRGAPPRHGEQGLPEGRAAASARSSSPAASRQLPTMTALLIKESVNQSVDNMGFQNALARLLHASTSSTTRTGRGCTRAACRRACPRTASRTGRKRRPSCWPRRTPRARSRSA